MNDACGRRFDGRFGELPAGFDHKYVFSHLGFNFKVTDMQAALGLAQLDRLEGFQRAAANFARLQRRSPSSMSGSSRVRSRRRRPVLVRLPVHAPRGRGRAAPELQRFLLERKIDNRLLLAAT